MNRKAGNLRRRHIVGMLTAAFVLLFGASAHAAENNVELNLSKGDIEISDEGYRQGGSDWKDGPKEKGSYIISGNGSTLQYGITVTGSEQHSITIKNVITGFPYGGEDAQKNAFYIAPGAEVVLTVKGENEFFSEALAGIAVPEGASLQITAQSTGKLTAQSGISSASAGIGGTKKDNSNKAEKNSNSGTIEINGGTIIARGRGQAVSADSDTLGGGAGIGGASEGKGGSITITGGTVDARGGDGGGAGIGGGYKGSGGQISIKGGMVMTADSAIGSGSGLTDVSNSTLTSGNNGTAWIDAGSIFAKKTGFTSGVLFEGNAGKLYGNYTLDGKEREVPLNKTLTVDSGQTLEIPASYPLVLDGSLINNGVLKIGNENSLTGNGSLWGSGEFYISSALSEDMFDVPQDLYSTGEDHTEYVKKYVQDSIQVYGVTSVMGWNFERVYEDGWKMELNPSSVIEEGTYTVTFTDPDDEENQVKKSFTVLDAGELASIEVTTQPEKKQYIYGERFSKTGMVITARYSIGGSKVVDNSEITAEDGNLLQVGQTSVTLSYMENGKKVSCIVDGIAVAPREVDLSKISWANTKDTFVYNGKPWSVDFQTELPEVLDMTINGTQRAADVGDYPVTIEFSLKEGCESNYVLVGDPVIEKVWKITPIVLEWVTDGCLAAVGNTRDEDVRLYGEIQVSGILPVDSADENIVTSFPIDKIEGTRVGKEAGDEEEIALSWKNEGDTLTFSKNGAAKNYILPDSLPVIHGIINQVDNLPLPPEISAANGTEYQLILERGISELPEGLIKNAGYTLPSELEKSLISAVMSQEGNISSQGFIDSYYLNLLKKEKRSDWKTVKADSVPAKEMTVTIPYPTGFTAETHDGIVAYMYPENMGEQNAGAIVYPEVNKRKSGIQFTVPGPGPVSIGWAEADPADGKDSGKWFGGNKGKTKNK